MKKYDEEEKRTKKNYTEPDKAHIVKKQVFDIGKTVDYKYEFTDSKNNLELIVQQKTADLINANKELVFQNEEKDKRIADLIIANKELVFQIGDKADRAAELVIASKELIFQNEEHYHEIFKYSTACIFVVDVEDEYKFKFNMFNLAAEKSTGLTTEQVSGKFIEEIFNEEITKELNKNYLNCCEQGIIISYEEGLSLSPGFGNFHTSLIPIKNSNGKVTRILGIAKDITELKLKEITLQERIKLETAISEASRLFVSQDKVNINEILKIIGETVLVNRAYVFKLREDGEKMDNLYEWCSNNTEPQIDLLQDLDSAIFPWWIKQLKDGNNIAFSDIENLPPEAIEEKNILLEQGIKSIFVAPIQSTYEILTGFIGFDDTEKHREWSDEDAKVLRVIAEMIKMYWDRKNSEEQLRESLENTRSMINDHEAVMLLIEPFSGKIIEANRAATTFYGYSNEEILNMFIQDINLLNKEEVAALRIKALDKGQKYFTLPHRLKNGKIRIVDAYSSLIDYVGKKILFSIIFDVTKREEIAKENEYLAYHDYLTDLYNRRFFEEELIRLDKKRNLPLSIIIADVNGLKLINDSFGHLAGDKLLIRAAKAISLACREDDIISRIGGDEFAIILPKSNIDDAKEVIDRIQKSLSIYKDEISILSISFGFATKIDVNEDVNQIRVDAEDRMYNNKMYESSSMRSKTIDVIMKSLYEKSEREAAHSKRVGNLCALIAEKMKFSEEKIKLMRITGLLHDIGKIGVSERILNKEGKLTKEEWAEIKKHPEAGFRILSSVKEFSNISEYVLAHHERWSGNGYPFKLIGEQIPVEARILSIADAFDAMTSKRSYREPMEIKDALVEMKACAGTDFDPEIVEVFIDLMKTKKNLNIII